MSHDDEREEVDYSNFRPDEEATFLGNNDFAFMQGLNKEFINRIVDTTVLYYKPAPSHTDSDIYGESPEGKFYYKPMELKGLIIPEDQETQDEDFGFEVQQDLQIGFQREELKKHQFYPEEGDIIEWSNYYFEVGSTVDNTLLASRFFMRHGAVVNVHSTRLSKEQIVDENYNS